MVEFVLVDAESVRPVRRAVLAPDGGRVRLTWPGDADERAMHFGVRDGEQLVAAATLVHEQVGELGSEVWRARGPFVLETQRRQGYGRRLLQALQAVAEKRGGGLWVRAPISALAFFSSQGFKAGSDAGSGDEDLLLVWHPKA